MDFCKIGDVINDSGLNLCAVFFSASTFVKIVTTILKTKKTSKVLQIITHNLRMELEVVAHLAVITAYHG